MESDTRKGNQLTVRSRSRKMYRSSRTRDPRRSTARCPHRRYWGMSAQNEKMIQDQGGVKKLLTTYVGCGMKTQKKKTVGRGPKHPISLRGGKGTRHRPP